MAQDVNEGSLKAIPELAAWLAITHQAEQESIAAKVAAGLWLLWPILAFGNLTQTTQTWVHASLLQVQAGWDNSAGAAAEFVQSSLWSVAPEADVVEPIKIEFPARDVAKALEATGPGTVRKLTPGIESDILEKGQKASSGAGQTLALDGGREQVMGQVLKLAATELGDTVVKDRQYAALQKYEAELADLRAKGISEDNGRVRRLNELADSARTSLDGYVQQFPSANVVEPKRGAGKPDTTLAARRSALGAIGWARVTDSNPCYFCAMLASLGAHFLTQDSFDQSDRKIRTIKRGDITERRAFIGEGQAKVHDNCKCSLRPVFSQADSRDKRAKFFLKQWEKLTEGKSNFAPNGHSSEAMKAFRLGYEPPPPYRVEAVLNDRRAAIDVARSNRDELFRRGLGDESPKVAFWEGVASQLEAI